MGEGSTPALLSKGQHNPSYRRLPRITRLPCIIPSQTHSPPAVVLVECRRGNTSDLGPTIVPYQPPVGSQPVFRSLGSSSVRSPFDEGIRSGSTRLPDQSPSHPVHVPCQSPRSVHGPVAAGIRSSTARPPVQSPVASSPCSSQRVQLGSQPV